MSGCDRCMAITRYKLCMPEALKQILLAGTRLLLQRGPFLPLQFGLQEVPALDTNCFSPLASVPFRRTAMSVRQARLPALCALACLPLGVGDCYFHYQDLSASTLGYLNTKKASKKLSFQSSLPPLSLTSPHVYQVC